MTTTTVPVTETKEVEQRPAFMDLVDDAVASAVEQVMGEVHLNLYDQPTLLENLNYDMDEIAPGEDRIHHAERVSIQNRINADAYARAAVKLVVAEHDINKAILYVLLEMRRGEYYKFLLNEYETLKEWAHHQLLNARNAEAENDPEQKRRDLDYLDRLVNSVENMLYPMDATPSTNTETGASITPEEIIEKANISGIKEGAGLFNLTLDLQQRDEIATTLTNGGKGKEIDALRTKIRATPRITKPEIEMMYMPDGTVKLFSVMTHDQAVKFEANASQLVTFVFTGEGHDG